jgi:hypothetical protein
MTEISVQLYLPPSFTNQWCFLEWLGHYHSWCSPETFLLQNNLELDHKASKRSQMTLPVCVPAPARSV